MHVVVTGGSGFIGRALCRSLSQKGHRVTVLTTHGRAASQVFGTSVTAVQWNGRDGGAWEKSLEGADAVVNLAGAPIADGRWTNVRKRLLTESRVQLTRCLAEAISQRSAKPRVLISASGIGYYGPNDDVVLSETAPRGEGGFLPSSASNGKERQDGLPTSALGSCSCGPGWSSNGTAGRCRRCSSPFICLSAARSCRGRSGCPGSIGTITSD